MLMIRRGLLDIRRTYNNSLLQYTQKAFNKKYEFTPEELKEREKFRQEVRQYNRDIGKHFDVQYGTNEVRR